jgi:hypothetical protein
VFICVFRHPLATASSMLRFCERMGKLKSVDIDRRHALRVWLCMHRHVVNTHCQTGLWHFVHYEQMFDEGARQRLEQVTGAAVAHDFPESRLSHARPQPNEPEDTRQQEPQLWEQIDNPYRALCEKANYRLPA